MIEGIKIFFEYIKLIDLVDIAIIATFIYMVLVWLKKTQARFIFIGMIIVGVIYFVARLLGLYLTTVALQAFFAVALIMVIIIFQDDLRRFFEKVAVFGVSRRRRPVTPSAHNIEIISSALANLSRKKIGALIVIKGADLLDRHLEAGVIVDSAISQILLESIFDRHVPSHDGAVIIDTGRIAALGCYLPLSTNIKEVGRLGTRHAAGLGITERTDAIALIVSEEEGSISLAMEGRIRHIGDPAHLTHALQDFYRKKFPEKKGLWIKRFLTEHWAEKAVSIIIACSLWVAFAHRTESVRRDFVVPIEYRNLAADRIIDEPKAKEVTVALSGNEQEFNLLKQHELKISLDMAAIKDGENKIPLSKDLVRNVSALSVISIDPAQVSLESYRLIPSEFPVEIKTRGRTHNGVTIKEMRVEPKTISIMVPSTMPTNQKAIIMEPIDLEPITDKTTVFPKINIAPWVRFPEDKIPQIKVFVDVEKKVEPDD